MKGSRRGRPQNPRGYTVVEVMMALAVLTLGAAGVIALQKVTLIGNNYPRNLTTANVIAQGWMERMRVDALSWNEPAGLPDIGETKWLTKVTSTTDWFSPDLTTAGTSPIGSPQADITGADVYGGDGSATAYCAQVRLTRFSTDPTLWALSRMIRVEVRVYWDKSGRQISCDPGALPTDYQLGRYGFVYLVSAVLENNSPI